MRQVRPIYFALLAARSEYNAMQKDQKKCIFSYMYIYGMNFIVHKSQTRSLREYINKGTEHWG